MISQECLIRRSQTRKILLSESDPFAAKDANFSWCRDTILHDWLKEKKILLRCEAI